MRAKCTFGGHGEVIALHVIVYDEITYPCYSVHDFAAVATSSGIAYWGALPQCMLRYACHSIRRPSWPITWLITWLLRQNDVVTLSLWHNHNVIVAQFQLYCIYVHDSLTHSHSLSLSLSLSIYIYIYYTLSRARAQKVVRHQAITWANFAPVLRRYMASLGHNELMHKNDDSMDVHN